MIHEDDVIATRSLAVRGDDGESIAALVRIGKPRRTDEFPGTETWVCDFEVVRPDGPLFTLTDEKRSGPLHRMSTSYGSDAIGAIENALIGLGIALDGLGDRVSSLDRPGYHGLRRLIYAYSPSMERHLANLVDEEMERIRLELKEPGGPQRVRARFPPTSHQA